MIDNFSEVGYNRRKPKEEGENMQLTREHWEKTDGEEFSRYLLTLSKGEEKGAWERRITNTALPAIAVPSAEADRIVREIARGNVREFLALDLWENLTQVLIRGKLIGKLKDFDEFKSYALPFARRADTWAATDCIKFPFTKGNLPQFFAFALECLQDRAHTFVRRLGLIILLKMSAMPEYTDGILRAADSLESENEYYVNMANAWLIAECFTHFRDKTLAYLTGAPHLNAFTINKAISKCRDSYRVSAEDKEFLKSLRK